MGRKVDVDELVSAGEIAKRLHLRGRQAVHDWRRRHPDFPAPVAKLDIGLVFAWPDVEKWARRTGRL